MIKKSPRACQIFCNASATFFRYDCIAYLPTDSVPPLKIDHFHKISLFFYIRDDGKWVERNFNWHCTGRFFMNIINFLKNPYFFISPSWHVIGCGFDENAVNLQLRKKCEIHVSADGLFTSTLCAILVDLPFLSVNWTFRSTSIVYVKTRINHGYDFSSNLGQPWLQTFMF